MHTDMEAVTAARALYNRSVMSITSLLPEPD